MNLDDIPIVRALPMVVGAIQVVAILFGLVALPGLIFYEAIKLGESKSTEETYYHAFRMVGWAGLMGVYYMLVLGTIVNICGGPDIMYGEWWFYLSKLFIYNGGSALFWADLIFYLVVATTGLTISWFIGSETEMGTFLPRWY